MLNEDKILMRFSDELCNAPLTYLVEYDDIYYAIRFWEDGTNEEIRLGYLEERMI